MADLVSSQILENGSRWFIAKFTNFSDGTGESGVIKIDPTSGYAGTTNQSLGVVIGGQTLYPNTHIKVHQIKYNVTNMSVRVQWKATSNQDMWILNGFDHLNFHQQGGLSVPNITGVTGQISFTTQGQAAGSSYTIDMWCSKSIVQ